MWLPDPETPQPRIDRGWLDDFRKRIEEFGHLYFQDDCGCIVFCMYALPEEIADAADDIARHVALGREVKRAKFGALPSFHCDQHVKAGTQA